MGVAEVHAQESKNDEQQTVSWREVLDDLWIEIVKQHMTSFADDLFPGNCPISRSNPLAFSSLAHPYYISSKRYKPLLDFPLN